METWKIIPGFSRFEASTLGNVRHIKHKRLRKFFISKDGYVTLKLPSDDGRDMNRMVHRLVYLAHAGEIADDTQIDHKNRVRTDNRYDNLREFKPIQNANNKKKIVSKVSYRRIEKVAELTNQHMNPMEIYEYLKRHPI